MNKSISSLHHFSFFNPFVQRSNYDIEISFMGQRYYKMMYAILSQVLLMILTYMRTVEMIQ